MLLPRGFVWCPGGERGWKLKDQVFVGGENLDYTDLSDEKRTE